MLELSQIPRHSFESPTSFPCCSMLCFCYTFKSKRIDDISHHSPIGIGSDDGPSFPSLFLFLPSPSSSFLTCYLTPICTLFGYMTQNYWRVYNTCCLHVCTSLDGWLLLHIFALFLLRHQCSSSSSSVTEFIMLCAKACRNICFEEHLSQHTKLFFVLHVIEPPLGAFPSAIK